MVVFFLATNILVSRWIIALSVIIVLEYMKDGQWFYLDGQLKAPHTQPLTAEIIQGSVTQHVLFVRRNKQQSTAVLQD